MAVSYIRFDPRSFNFPSSQGFPRVGGDSENLYIYTLSLGSGLPVTYCSIESASHQNLVIVLFSFFGVSSGRRELEREKKKTSLFQGILVNIAIPSVVV